MASELGSETGDDGAGSEESGHADLADRDALTNETTDGEHLLAGRYRLVRRIGTGAMGVVWQGHDELLNRPVAVKKLLLVPGLPSDDAEEAVARCLREGRIAARLHHPNAITVFDVVDEDGVPCLVMEYLPSRSMATVLAEDGLLSPVAVATIGAQVASALTAAHAAGIVHRDIKPANVLLGEDGSVKITDFGISRAADDVSVTKTGIIAGTPAYLAPEVALGVDPTPASDLFSLGATLYTAVEGESPFGVAANTLGLLHRVALGQINPPQQSGPLTEVLTALLAAEPQARPTASTAHDLLAAVAAGGESAPLPVVAAQEDEGTALIAAPTDVAEPTVMVRPTPAPASRSRRPLVAAGMLLVALVAAGAWLLGGQNELVPVEKNVPANGTEQGGTAPNVESAPVVPANAGEPISNGEKPATRTSETRTGTSAPVNAGAPTTTTTSAQPTTTTENAPEPTTTTDPPTTTSDAPPTEPESAPAEHEKE